MITSSSLAKPKVAASDELNVIYSPPFLMTKDELTKLLDIHPMEIKRKIIAKELSPDQSHILV